MWPRLPLGGDPGAPSRGGPRRTRGDPPSSQAPEPSDTDELRARHSGHPEPGKGSGGMEGGRARAGTPENRYIGAIVPTPRQGGGPPADLGLVPRALAPALPAGVHDRDKLVDEALGTVDLRSVGGLCARSESGPVYTPDFALSRRYRARRLEGAFVLRGGSTVVDLGFRCEGPTAFHGNPMTETDARGGAQVVEPPTLLRGGS